MSMPHLLDIQTGPMLALEGRILAAQSKVEDWFRGQWQVHKTPFYSSVDLRNSGFKLVPVDMNMFPGGFNNLGPDFTPLAVQAARNAMARVSPQARSLLLIPENHTRNTYYLQNVASLLQIFEQAGLDVRLGSLNPDITEPTALIAPDGAAVNLEPVLRRANRLMLADGFNPDMVLLNKDLSGGIPALLQNLEQTLLPPLYAGWAVRRKSHHFRAYDIVADDFARLLGIDPWLINPLFGACGGIDFHSQHGLQALADTVSDVLARMRVCYREHRVGYDPFVIVKADAGTYGMGVMTVKTPEDVLSMSHKTRAKMAVVKEGLAVSEVIVQEGVHTFETVQGAVAEPVIYMIDQSVIGGFYRVNEGRGVDENLNAPGMNFSPLPVECMRLPESAGVSNGLAGRFYSYGVIARLALLAGSLELETTDPARNSGGET